MTTARPPRIPLAVVPIVLVAAACGGEAAGTATRWEASVDTVGDTIRVHTVSGSVWGDTATLEPELSIGVFEGAEEEMFGDVRAIAVTPAGAIYVLDRQLTSVRRFGPGGTYLGSLGREGGGPGELRQPEAMALLPDGRLVVRDPGNGRINVWDSTGKSLPSWRLPSGGGLHTSTPIFVDTASNSYTPLLLQNDADVTEWRWGLAHFAPDGTHSDTLIVPTWDFDPPTVIARKEGSSSSNNVPFSPQVSWTFSPLGYFVGGLSTDYRIDLFRHDQPVLRIERDWTPVPVLGAEKSEQEHRIVENFKQSFGSWRWNGPPIPDTKPPFKSVLVGNDGRLWVMLSQPGYEYRTEADALEEEKRTNNPQLRYREHGAFDVFEPDGRYVGLVRVPDEFRTLPQPVFRGDHVWAVTRDDLDVQRVVRYRVVHGEGQ
jgi:hypothetical protein